MSACSIGWHDWRTTFVENLSSYHWGMYQCSQECRRCGKTRWLVFSNRKRAERLTAEMGEMER